jgi:hypothetical protein
VKRAVQSGLKGCDKGNSAMVADDILIDQFLEKLTSVTLSNLGIHQKGK